MQSGVSPNAEALGDGIVSTQTDSFDRLFDGSLILSDDRQNRCPQVHVWYLGPRIILDPKIAGFYSLWDVAGNSFMVGGGDPILLRLTGAVAQFKCLCAVVHREAGLKSTACHDAQVSVRHRKVGVEFDGMFEERRRRVRAFCPECVYAGSVSLQGLKRGCRCLLQRCIKLLDRAERLAQLIPYLDGHVSKCIE